MSERNTYYCPMCRRIYWRPIDTTFFESSSPMFFSKTEAVAETLRGVAHIDFCSKKCYGDYARRFGFGDSNG